MSLSISNGVLVEGGKLALALSDDGCLVTRLLTGAVALVELEDAIEHRVDERSNVAVESLNVPSSCVVVDKSLPLVAPVIGALYARCRFPQV